MRPLAGTKRSSPARWLWRSCSCEESLADGFRFALSILYTNTFAKMYELERASVVALW
jgi:hypothetical protein